jgi:hypothetical protein
MTQDQYGQSRGPGYVVRGDAVPDETEEYETGQSKPMTRFQKVASALRGDRTDDETYEDETPDATPPGANPPWVTEQDEAAMANTPVSREATDTAGVTGPRTGGTAAGTGAGAPRGDYWDEPRRTKAGQDEAVAVTNPDVPVRDTGTDPVGRRNEAAGQPGPDAMDHAATEPDMFGTATRAGNGTAAAPAAEGQAGAATIADVPASDAAVGGAPVGDAPVNGVAAGDTPASGIPDPAAGATGATGRHATGTPAGSQLRPGEAAGTLGDFSDLTYGNLIPDVAVYTEQWQQIQFRFVDDPHGSVTEAADIVAQVTAKMEAAVQERQRAIEERQRAIQDQQRSLRGRWSEGTNTDTEALRETLRMYKTFLDQLIGPRAS